MSLTLLRARWRPGPLRRRVDVVEARLAVVLGCGVCVCAPLAGVLAGWSSADHERALAAVRREQLHGVVAEVVVAPARDAVRVDETGRTTTVPVTVRWTDGDGRRITASTRLPADVERGDRTRLWLDDRERLSAAPPDAHDITVGAWTTGVWAASWTAGAGVVTGVVVHRVCERCRAASWEHEWARTEPVWSRRTP
ncbi:hypothetical protein C6N75_02415 [Streptomyces solincola]|uniref:Uncharacterized protein n=1 Tax=Streptomyces solincola TaxID=2100817 RepID=A0A2S9Q254_9ACTN|nr:hypothetical protein [Streptomyces solincola]PRH80765.1 hypothetical protein C6N75_02415 [Streptomyces solincola]